jgi:glucan endo-1,3-alpha-glucosidase
MMSALFKSVAGVLFLLAAVGHCTVAIAQENVAQEKLVFADYMVCCPLAGENVTADDFLAEIRAAHEAGIDGFVLDCGEWDGAPRYKRNSAMLFEAARRFGPDFKLFFAADLAGAKMGFDLSADEAADMVVRYRDHPNQLRYQGRPVLNTFMGDSAWFRAIRTKIREKTGEDVFLVPFFYPSNGHEVPNQRDFEELTAQSDNIDGYSYFGAAGAPDDLAGAIRRHAGEWSKRGKLFMAGIAPYYRGLRGNYRVFENNGYAGLAKQWMAAIQSNTSWVQLVTWNDWGEDTYFAPLDAADGAVRWADYWGYLLSHHGFLAANRYFIDWFKSGQPPPIGREQVFYAYRLHRKYVPGRIVPLEDRLGWPLGALELADQINVLGLLRAPAEVVLGTGAISRSVKLEAGVSEASLPMQNGPVSFVVRRGGLTIGAKTAEFPISVMDGWSNFNMLAGEIPIVDDAANHPSDH